MSVELLDQNFYEILEVSADATAQHVERAYRIARATYQPASTATYSVFSDEDNSDILRRIEEAYAVLSDDRLRREYDARLRREGSPEPRRMPSNAAAATRAPLPQAPPGPAPQGDLDLPGDEENGDYDGQLLHRLRIQRGIELEEIAAVTKISETYLSFIETNRYADLPAPVYVRGFVREIAKCLKLEPKAVVDGYMRSYEQGLENA